METHYEHTQRLLSLLLIDQELLSFHSSDTTFLDAINDKAEELMESLLPYAANFLGHELVYYHNSNYPEYEDMVRNIIHVFPKVLKDKDDDRNLPIHYAARKDNAVTVVPILAEEGTRLSLFDEKERGGLLVQDGLGFNVFEQLCRRGGNGPPCDEYCMYVFERLQKSGLFINEDVRDHDLMYHCLQTIKATDWKGLFDFLIKCDEDGLRMWRSEDDLPLLMNATFSEEDFKCAMYLAFRLNEFELVFERDPSGSTAFSMACENIGFDQACSIVVEEGKAWHGEEWISNIDKVKNTYPFMVAATSGNKEELSLVYHLLWSEPTVLGSAISMIHEDFESCSNTSSDTAISNSYKRKRP